MEEEGTMDNIIMVAGSLKRLFTTPFLTTGGINLLHLFPHLTKTGVCDVETLFFLENVCYTINNGQYFYDTYENYHAANYCRRMFNGSLQVMTMEEAQNLRLIKSPITTNALLLLNGMAIGDLFSIELNITRGYITEPNEEIVKEKLLAKELEDYVYSSLVDTKFCFINFMKHCLTSREFTRKLMEIGLNPVIPCIYYGLTSYLHENPQFVTINIYLFTKETEKVIGLFAWPKHKDGLYSVIIKDIITSKLICGRRLIEKQCISDIYPMIVTSSF